MRRGIGLLFAATLIGFFGYQKFIKPPQRHQVKVATCVMLADGNHFVLGLRKKENQYGFIGGHVEANESIYQGAIREAKEETGIDLDEKDFELIHVLHGRGKAGDYLLFFIRSRSWKGEIQNLEPDKCLGWDWVNFDQLPQNMLDWTQKGIANIQKGVFFSEYGW